MLGTDFLGNKHTTVRDVLGFHLAGDHELQILPLTALKMRLVSTPHTNCYMLGRGRIGVCDGRYSTP